MSRVGESYLGRADAIRLISEPAPSLPYPPQVPERLFEQTQGHPALLQRLCKELVDIANRDDRRPLAGTGFTGVSPVVCGGSAE